MARQVSAPEDAPRANWGLVIAAIAWLALMPLAVHYIWTYIIPVP